MTQDTEVPVLEVEEEEKIHEECETSAQSAETQDEELSLDEKAAVCQQAKRIIEALLFCSTEPVTLRRMTNVLHTYHPLDKSEVKQLLDELTLEYEEQHRSFRLEEIAKGYILRTCEEFSSYIHALLKTARPEKLSHAAAEVLAIIAFRQPITRPQIDEVRGVDSSGIVSTLIERQLIEPAGKLEVPGRPTLFAITKNFLKYFGLKDINELPNMGSNIKMPVKHDAVATQESAEESEESQNTEGEKSEVITNTTPQVVVDEEQSSKVINSAEETVEEEEEEENGTEVVDSEEVIEVNQKEEAQQTTELNDNN